MHVTQWQTTSKRADLQSAVAALKKVLLVTTTDSEQQFFVTVSSGSVAVNGILALSSAAV